MIARLLILLLCSGVMMARAVIAEPLSWQFSVLLNDKPVGTHRWTLTPGDTGYEVLSEAEMRVKVLFVEAFRYQHQSRELWQQDCLARIDARTEINSKTLTVSGRSGEGRFILDGADADMTMPDCLRSFAYWDADVLRTATGLLNPQSGELVDIRVEEAGVTTLPGSDDTARQLSLRGKDLHIDLWYREDGSWVGLRSLLPKGRELIYRLEEGPGAPERISEEPGQPEGDQPS